MKILLCKVGIHDWYSDSCIITSDDGKTIALIWWVCRRCSHNKLKFIGS